MGSCTSPVVGNIFIKHIERQALTALREPTRIWLRYVDDVFFVMKSSVIDDIHHRINSSSPNVKFTQELEQCRRQSKRSEGALAENGGHQNRLNFCS